MKTSSHLQKKTLPALEENYFLTDGGIETTLIFHNGFELPYFAAFDLLRHQKGYRALRHYFQTYAKIAQEYEVGLILESPTWRASPDWGTKLGYSKLDLKEANQKSIKLLREVKQKFESAETPILISGCIGPRGDGYLANKIMNVDEAFRYHSFQVNAFRDELVDLVTALTMTYVNEAIGITKAAQKAGLPVVISFTVETNGKLPSGETLKEAIAAVDQTTSNGPLYYMINCAHPDHFEHLFQKKEPWLSRIKGVRANASRKSHAELNEATTLDDGDPEEFGTLHAKLLEQLPELNVLGGCCGTDQRHIESVIKACVE